MAPSSKRRPRNPRSGKETGPGPFTKFVRLIWGLAMMIILVVFGLSVTTRILEQEKISRIDPPIPDETSVTVIVLNGCGVNGLAGHVRDLLIDGGCFDVVDIDDADDFHYPETLIVDLTSSGRSVQQVADYMHNKLNIGRVVHHRIANPPAAVIIILGMDAASPGGAAI